MGLWGTIAGIGASLIPGVGPVLGPIVGAAVNGVEQSKAAKDASQAQVSAGNKALDLYSNIYGQQRADLAPYRSAGTSALGAEMSLLGLPGLGAMPSGPMGYSVSGTDSGTQPYTGLTGSAAPPGFQAGAIGDPNANGGYGGQSHGTDTLGARGSVADTTSSYGPKSSPVPTLKVQGPDGQVYMIPADQAADAQKNGGQVIGPA
jgi:hypothetical protein